MWVMQIVLVMWNDLFKHTDYSHKLIDTFLEGKCGSTVSLSLLLSYSMETHQSIINIGQQFLSRIIWDNQTAFVS